MDEDDDEGDDDEEEEEEEEGKEKLGNIARALGRFLLGRRELEVITEVEGSWALKDWAEVEVGLWAKQMSEGGCGGR